jgi:hypothetical protein
LSEIPGTAPNHTHRTVEGLPAVSGCRLSAEFTDNRIGGAKNRVGDMAASCELKAIFAVPGCYVAALTAASETGVGK